MKPDMPLVQRASVCGAGAALLVSGGYGWCCIIRFSRKRTALAQAIGWSY